MSSVFGEYKALFVIMSSLCFIGLVEIAGFVKVVSVLGGLPGEWLFEAVNSGSKIYKLKNKKIQLNNFVYLDYHLI